MKNKYLKYKFKYLYLKKDINNISIFIQSMFTFLKNYDMCFINGTIIFEDNDNKLYNILTYNLNVSDEYIVHKEKLSSEHWLTSNQQIFSKNDQILPINDHVNEIKPTLLSSFCHDKKCLKLILQFNEKIKFLCDENTKIKNYKDELPKQFILYYRFKFNEKQYLFFKLESNVNNIIKQIHEQSNEYQTSYNYRTELNYLYNYSQLEKDLNFYLKIYNELYSLNIHTPIYTDEIKFYNYYLRTGNELFISESIKNYMIHKLYK